MCFTVCSKDIEVNALEITVFVQKLLTLERSRLRGNLLTKDGSVVVWGDANDGGDCRKVNDQLHDVQLIAGSGNGETAIRCSWPILATLHHVLRCIQ